VHKNRFIIQTEDSDSNGRLWFIIPTIPSLVKSKLQLSLMFICMCDRGVNLLPFVYSPNQNTFDTEY